MLVGDASAVCMICAHVIWAHKSAYSKMDTKREVIRAFSSLIKIIINRLDQKQIKAIAGEKNVRYTCERMRAHRLFMVFLVI